MTPCSGCSAKPLRPGSRACFRRFLVQSELYLAPFRTKLVEIIVHKFTCEIIIICNFKTYKIKANLKANEIMVMVCFRRLPFHSPLLSPWSHVSVRHMYGPAKIMFFNQNKKLFFCLNFFSQVFRGFWTFRMLGPFLNGLKITLKNLQNNYHFISN